MKSKQSDRLAGRKSLCGLSPFRQHLREFALTPLWRGLLPAFLFGFGVVTLLCLAHYGIVPRKVLLPALLAGGCCAFGYTLGVWSATAPDKEDEQPEEPEAKNLPLWLQRAIVIGLVLIALGAVAWPSLARVQEGTRSLFDGSIEILAKLMAAVCTVVPIWIAERRR